MMKNYKKVNIFLLGLLVVLLSSCDPEGKDVFVINNRTETDLYVGYRTYVNRKKWFIKEIKIGSSTTFFEYEHVSGLLDRGEDFLGCLDSISIMADTISGIPINDSWKKRENWSFVQKKNSPLSRSGTNTYIWDVYIEDL